MHEEQFRDRADDRGPQKRLVARWAAATLAAGAVAGGSVFGVLAATGSGDGAPVAAATTTRPGGTSAGSPAGGELDVEEVYERAAPGVVLVRAGGEPGGRGGLGSGFVIDREGRIVTNYHVVAGAGSVEVVFSDESEADARIIGTDPSSDLALLDVETPAEELTALPLGDSDSLVVGEDAFAIGNPFGLERTLTAGVVSGLDRRIEAPDGFAIDDAVQTDAALNSGNSGGPLLNARAEVIGVNTQIESRTGGNVGIGYAVPVNTVKEVVRELLADGEVERAYLGVSMQDVTEELARTLDLPVTSGVLITSVRDGSPAERAGLRGGQNGDVITAIDGRAVDSSEDVSEVVSSREPGDRIEVEIRRGDASETVTVALADRPS